MGWVIAEKWPYRNVMASTRIRCFDIIQYLKKHGIKTRLYNTFKKYDIVVFQKAFEKKHYDIAKKLKSQGSRIVLDLNVNYFEKKGETRQVTEKQVESLHSFLKLTDTVLVSSPNLKETAQKYHRDVHYIPEHISTAGSYTPSKPGNPVRLLYCGYAIKADSVLLIENVMRDLADRYNLEFIFICEKDPRLKMPVKTSFIKYDHNNLADILRRGDIKIAPRRLDNSYDLGHSFTKIGYPMSVGLPVVASPVPSYLGSPALIAESEEDWLNHITTLINEPGYYSQLSKEGISFVQTHYSLEIIGRMYLDILSGVMHA